MGSDPQHDEFLRIFSRHSRRLYEFVSTLVFSSSDAEDVFQNTCVVLWKKFDTYDPEGSFYAWGCKIAYFEVLNMRRSNKKLQAFSEEVLSLLADEMISRSEELNVRQEALQHCLAKLQAEEKELVRERYYLRRPPKEIAKQKGTSVHSVYRAMVRIHNTLRDCVDRSMAKERHT